MTTGTCFAELGHDVTCVDIDKQKIENLNKGILPIYEPGLKELVERNVKEKRIVFTADIKDAVEKSDVIFITVGTPQGKDGKADLVYVFKAAEDIGKYLNGYKVIADKSTVPVGTAGKVKEIIGKFAKHPFDVVSNPEFLREGAAVKDFLNPDRVVIGSDSEKAKQIMGSVYKAITRTDKPIIFTDTKSAELIKYASNAMLAARISFMNEVSHLCEKVGADVKSVAKGMGFDNRIGPRFLQAGIGYGGSCFPKDVQAFIHTMKENGCEAEIMSAVESVNHKQKLSLIPKIKRLVPDLKGKTIAIWGIAFKPRTDDIREAPSLLIIQELLKEGAKIKAFDPIAEENARKVFPSISYFGTAFDAVKDADALIICTEWDEFRNIDREKLKLIMKHPNVIDGRNIWEPDEMKSLGFNYIGVGR